MQTVRKHITISAPAADVFAFLNTPSHLPEITPCLTRFERIEQLPNDGARLRYTVRIFGAAFSGELKATDHTPNNRMIWSMTGDLRGTLRWYLSSSEGDRRTRFTYAATYRVPGPSFLQRLLSPIARRYAEREIETLLDNLQTRIGH